MSSQANWSLLAAQSPLGGNKWFLTMRLRSDFVLRNGFLIVSKVEHTRRRLGGCLPEEPPCRRHRQ